MLNRIGCRISKERPDLFIFPIHDCWVTTVGNEAYVTRIIKEETERAIGLIPTVKLKIWQ